MINPYRGLPPERFWKTGVAQQDPLAIDLYRKKYEIPADAAIATAGSCFAQNVTRWLKAQGLNFLDAEPAPNRLSVRMTERYQFGVYSCRYGNIYTPKQLRQIAEEAIEGRDLSAHVAWLREDGRLVDAFRPAIDPDGFDSTDDVLLHRCEHLDAVRRMFAAMDVFVFTLGLTEAWLATDEDVVFPTAPGTIAGRYDPARYRFANLGYGETLADMQGAIALIRKVNPGCRFLLTVSPVPLTATAVPQHILLSTIYSKSVLRAVAGDIAAGDPLVDYFPSYELFNNVMSQGRFFNEDARTARPEGVSAAMRMFGEAHFPAGQAPAAGPAPAAQDKPTAQTDEGDDLVCEEALLEAFAPADGDHSA